MKPINVYLTVAVMLLSLQSIAQKKDKEPDKSQFKRLYIGDRVDMESIVFNNVRNYPGGKAKLSDFKGKYIVLDFWSKTCSSCIAAFPKMEELQQQFKDDIQVLLVTENTEDELSLLLKNSPNVKGTKLPMVLGEKLLTQNLFPRSSSPYHVWLDREGKVIASTESQETTSKNIKNLVNGKPLNLIVRYDNEDENLFNELRNPSIPLLKVHRGYLKNHLKYYAQIPTKKIANSLPLAEIIGSIPYYSMFLDYIPNISQFANGFQILKDTTGKERGFRIFNDGLYGFFYWAYLDKGNQITKIIAEGNARSLYEDITDTTDLKRHLMRNSFCYESCLPEYSLEKAKKLLQQDISRFLGIIGTVEERPLKCFVLKRLGTNQDHNLWMKDQNIPIENYKEGLVKDGFEWKNLSFSYLASWLSLSNPSMDDPVFIDETGFTKGEYAQRRIDVLLKCKSLHLTSKNLLCIRKELARYGLGLNEETRKMKVLVLREL